MTPQEQFKGQHAALAAAAHLSMRALLAVIPPVVLVLCLSAGTPMFWVYAALYGVTIGFTGFGLSKQRTVLLLVAPLEARAWMQPVALALVGGGVILLLLSVWRLGIRIAAL